MNKACLLPRFHSVLYCLLLSGSFIASPATEGHSEMNEPVQCTLIATPTTGQIQFTIRNTDTTPWQFLSWNTPFDAWFSQFLTITHAGTPLKYQGALAKRGKPQEEDFILLDAMQTLTINLDLLQAYKIPPGQYQVTIVPIPLAARQNNSLTRPHTAQESFLLHCNTLALTIHE